MTVRGTIRISTWLVLSIALVAPLLAPLAAATPAPTASVGDRTFEYSAAGYANHGITARVLWNGVDIYQAANASSAFQVGYSTSSVDVRYFWNATNPADSYNVSSVRLQMFYFGLSIVSRDVSPLTQSAGDLSWNAIQTVQWLMEGTYLLAASLVSPDGSILWIEGFYVHVAAPYGVLAAIPIILIIIFVYEVYNIARSGRSDMVMVPKNRGPPTTSPPSAPGPEPPTGSAPPPGQGAS
jgi:hypothetical protein